MPNLGRAAARPRAIRVGANVGGGKLGPGGSSGEFIDNTGGVCRGFIYTILPGVYP